MVLGDDLLVFLIIDHEVLDVVEQLGWIEQSIDQALKTCLVVFNLVTVDLLLFVIRAKPMKEVLPTGRRTADFGFHGIAEHDQRTGVKDLRNVFFVVGQVIVKGRFQFDVGVLQLEKDQRDTVDV